MHRISLYTDPRDIFREATSPKPWGPGFDEAEAREATEFEILGSGFRSPGNDYCIFILRKNGVEIARCNVEGY